MKEEKPQVMKTPPVEEVDSGSPIREMRVQLRPESEHGSRGSRRVRRCESGAGRGGEVQNEAFVVLHRR